MEISYKTSFLVFFICQAIFTSGVDIGRISSLSHILTKMCAHFTLYQDTNSLYANTFSLQSFFFYLTGDVKLLKKTCIVWLLPFHYYFLLIHDLLIHSTAFCSFHVRKLINVFLLQIRLFRYPSPIHRHTQLTTPSRFIIDRSGTLIKQRACALPILDRPRVARSDTCMPRGR